MNCLSEISNTHENNTKDLDAVISMYKLLECSDNCIATSGNLWQYCRDEPSKNLKYSRWSQFKSTFTNNTNTRGNKIEKIDSFETFQWFLENFGNVTSWLWK